MVRNAVSHKQQRLTIDGYGVRFYDHPEFHEPANIRDWPRQAERLMTVDGRLGPADELILFKAMHLCGSRLQKLTGGLNRGKRARQWLSLHGRLVERVVQNNIGLIYDMQRRIGMPDLDLDELRSEGHWALYQAAINFNPWLGFRFSTYACHAILRSYRQLGRRTKRRRAHNEADLLFEEINEDFSASGGDEGADDFVIDRIGVVLERNEAMLTPAERLILEQRILNPPEGKPATLASIGKLLRISKERVRQLQVGALGKLRHVMEEKGIGPAPSTEAG